MTAVDPSPAAGVDLVVEGLRALGNDRSLAAVRQLTTRAATTLPGVDDASLTIRARNGFETVATTGELPPAVDALQYRYGGPCVDTVVGVAGPEVHVPDLRTDDRWRDFASAAVDQTRVLGVLSLRLAVGLQDTEEIVSSLNLYATKPHAFASDTLEAGRRLAAYTGAVLAYAAEREKARNLEQALHSSRDIGAAIGIVMSRYLVTRDRAFELLRTASQHKNRKLRDLAEDVLGTGELPAGLELRLPQR